MGIVIHKGDIFEVKASALVIPANTQVELNWGSHIAETVNGLWTESVKAERAKRGPLELGEACLTAGDGTSFQHLIHAAVLDKYDFNPLFLLRLRQRTSDATLTKALKSVRAIAQEHSLESLAISAMGAGIGAMNYTKCVRLTFQELHPLSATVYFAAYKPRHQKIATAILKEFQS